MSLGFPARCAVVFAIVAVAGAARAQQDRRKVAVVGLSEDPAAHDLANALYTELVNHWALQPVGPLDPALFGRFLDEDGNDLALATERKNSAESDLLQFQNNEAAIAAEEGLRQITGVSPVKAAPLAADLAFDEAVAELSRKHGADAARLFAFVHRLDPARKLDPVRFDPDVVAAYGKAAAAQPGIVKLTVKGSGRVWIDGVEKGAAPGDFDVEQGDHLVQLAGSDRIVRGRIEHVQHDQALEIGDAPATTELLVERARLALKQTPEDAVARAPAMKHLAGLLGVHDAVLIWKSANGMLLVQTWRDVAPGFSALREYVSGEPVLPLLEPLSPPKPPPIDNHEAIKQPPPPPFNPPPHVEPEPAWYRRTWVQASVAGGVVAAVIGGIVWARQSKHISIGNNPQWEGM